MTTEQPTGMAVALRDVLTVAIVAAVLAAACRPFENVLSLDRVTLVMALFAAAAGATAATFAVLAARLTGERRIGWLSMALGCYSLVAIPAATIGVLDVGPAPAVGAARFLAHCLVVTLLLTAVLAPGPLTGRRAAGWLLAAAAAVCGAGALGTAFPVMTQAVTTYQPLRLGVALAWVGLGLVVAVLAAREGRDLWRVGLGITILGVAHVDRVSAIVSPVADLGLAFSAMRLMGIALVLMGTARLAQEAVAQLDAGRDEREEELRLVEIQLADAAERDHELRSGLAGLAGATNLLGADRPGPHGALLGTVVASELARLDELLRSPVGLRTDPHTRGGYAVAPVLTGLAALRSSSGMDLRLNVEPGLRARGSSTILAQVITNLLGNAARHAPGSPVRIGATRHEGQVVIRVSDFGPGVAPGQESVVFAPGVRDERSGGLGLGLHICRGLTAAENGSISIQPPAPGRRGCTVVVRLPAEPPAAPRPIVAAGLRCRAS